jgi:hypothetical protein
MPKFQYATFYASNHYSPSGARPGVFVTFPDGTTKDYDGTNTVSAALNELGADGWEFVGTIDVLEDGQTYSRVGVLKRAG